MLSESLRKTRPALYLVNVHSFIKIVNHKWGFKKYLVSEISDTWALINLNSLSQMFENY